MNENVMEHSSKIQAYREQVLSMVNLPTLPIIATEIIRATREDKISVNQILPILEKDPPLAMKVLKIANSAYYGMRERVTSLRHAVVVIGLDQLNGLALSFSVIKAVHNDPDQRKLNWKSFWEHSSTTGIIAQMLVEDLGITIDSNTYAVGLLHDIGKLILFKLDAAQYGKTYNLCRELRCSSIEAEKEVFGVTHPQVGGWISEKWKLPENMITGILNHHQPSLSPEADHQTLAALIQTADWIANHYTFRFANFLTVFNPLDVEGWQILKNRYGNLNDNDLQHFLSNVEEQLDSIKEMASLIYY